MVYFLLKSAAMARKMAQRCSPHHAVACTGGHALLFSRSMRGSLR
jgi:hypothetical protein